MFGKKKLDPLLKPQKQTTYGSFGPEVKDPLDSQVEPLNPVGVRANF